MSRHELILFFIQNVECSNMEKVESREVNPAKPKHVELNLKTPKNLDSLGNEHNPFSQPVHKGNTATKISLFENKRGNSSLRHTDIRGTRNTPASNKTFVGRAKLNLAKKAKEMEQPEKKVMPNSPQNGALVKETPAETKVTPSEEEIVPATRRMNGHASEYQSLGPQPNQDDKADGQTDAGCPSEPVASALIPVKDHKLVEKEASEAADSKRPVLEHVTSAAQDISTIVDTKDLPPTATPKPQDTFSDSQPPAESSPGPSFSLSAPIPVDVPKDTCVELPISSFLCTDLKVSENHKGCALPVSHQNNEKMPLSELGGETNPPLSTEHSPEAVGSECPSRVLVQVRSFVLPMESTQDVSSQVIPESSEVREVQLPTCHNNEPEVVSVASCAPLQEEVLGNKSMSPEQSHCTEELAAKSGPQVMPPASEKTLPIQAQSQGSRALLMAESSPTNSPSSGNHLDTPQRPGQTVANGQDSSASLLNISAGSDDSVFDSSSDMEKFTEIIKQMDSTVCMPMKRKKARMPNSPAPHFAMPPIHEDHLEKVFDPNVFTFGLGKKKESQPEMSPALHLMQFDTKSKLRPKRASTEQSVLFKSLHTNTNGNSEPPVMPEINDKENRDVTNGGIKRSRLEKSALFSSLLSSLPQDKIFSPSVTSVNTMTTAFSTSQNGSLSQPSVSQPTTEGAPPCGLNKEQPNLPPNSSLKVFNFNSSTTSHSSLKSPSHMEKYLQKEKTKEDLDSRSNLHSPETKFSEFSKLKNDDMEKTNHIESVLKSNLPNCGNNDNDFMGLFKSTWYDPSISFSGMSLSDTMFKIMVLAMKSTGNTTRSK
ncbi:Beta/gamma crystallin domain-containing protein 1, partial [Plecturocebus cupreus]